MPNTKIATAAQGAADLLRQNIMINLVQDSRSLAGQKLNDPAALMIATARARRKHITLVDKANVLQTSVLWRKVVADRLGHSSVSMTLDVYSHVLPHIQDNATEKMANVMRVKK